jgi:hypothetical protein
MRAAAVAFLIIASGCMGRDRAVNGGAEAACDEPAESAEMMTSPWCGRDGVFRVDFATAAMAVRIATASDGTVVCANADGGGRCEITVDPEACEITVDFGGIYCELVVAAPTVLTGECVNFTWLDREIREEETFTWDGE